MLLPDDCAGTVNALGFDILRDVVTAHCTFSGSPSSVDPALDLLQDNGGATFTEALLPGSPAIDTGDPGGCADDLATPLLTDQRGRPRPANGAGLTRCDIGAFELQRLLYLPLVRR